MCSREPTPASAARIDQSGTSALLLLSLVFLVLLAQSIGRYGTEQARADRCPAPLGSFSPETPTFLPLSPSRFGIAGGYGGDCLGRRSVLCRMKEPCAHGERYRSTSDWDWRAFTWLPESSAEWTMAIASLLLLTYIIREYVVPMLKRYARRRCMELGTVAAALPVLASAVARTPLCTGDTSCPRERTDRTMQAEESARSICLAFCR